MKSFDPRINRISLPAVEETVELKKLDEWETYEVFHQKKRGDQHVHAGIVHAPSAELALMFAKEQYGRRRVTSNIWVVRSSDILATDYDDADIFETTPEKTYREASGSIAWTEFEPGRKRMASKTARNREEKPKRK